MSSTHEMHRSIFRRFGRVGPIFGIFTVAIVALFAVLYFMTTAYLREIVDARLQRKCAQLVSRPFEEVRESVLRHSLAEGGAVRPYGLFDAGGRRIEGNIDNLAPGLRDYTPFLYVQSVTEADGQRVNRTYRAMVATMPLGQKLVVGQAIDEVNNFDHMLIVIGAAGLLGTLALGAACGLLLHRASTLRIRLLRQACQEIADSRVDKRLPVRGNQDDVDVLIGFVNTMLDDIERLVQELQGVCSWIAHDLRTPMSRLRAGLEQARRNALTVTDYDRAVDAALAQTNKVLDRFSALLRIAEIETRTARAHFSDADLCTICRDVVELYEPLAEEHRICLALSVCGEASVRGDSDLIFGAIQNLIDNAIKFTPMDGVVTVEVTAARRFVSVVVRDTGPGIAPAERDAVLRPFYCGARAGAAPTPGYGLGLSIVAATARVHNAALAISSGNPGCVVELKFPLD
ncbi:sensor histidine kinase [Pandoraea anhela]|uniref:histidine kinase n=1 Tax=Pandoraea anhela TaxID=2508295 RepID=A0A5E4Z941_9BURK|nr:ATP-binding protein [Pandoraea anhela]VVE56840.1 Sensor kinase CusS [Pandoraea anhela]